MYMITEQKPLEEVLQQMEGDQSVYVLGCGTCPAVCHTGGKPEVLDMVDRLTQAGKEVCGWMVAPTACDESTGQALKWNAEQVQRADSILVMACGYGVQTVVRHTDKAVYPALNTLFLGKEGPPGEFAELCLQCGACLLGMTAGVCPITACAKSLVNGPCGGYRDGKCEVHPDRDCAWCQIFERLERLGQRDKLYSIPLLKDHSKFCHPRHRQVAAGGNSG
ncbi:MAG TPA: methylenetetrahydrofolate reductase C-terminal domain-containing protein [Dehalococcoidia bacterium]|nr:methylenetetrahydrofolate reductase C-terminal domain-containing protein [Dehalococcoidia bacterium]HLC30568.1 methylenetetrahydrofolate reductase C-terminal domain-containing protein [Dehalococcoidia bacterium]